MPFPTLTPEQENELRRLIATGKKGEAVALLRRWTGLSQQAAETAIRNLDSIA